MSAVYNRNCKDIVENKGLKDKNVSTPMACAELFIVREKQGFILFGYYLSLI
jgi:hypothetical protein